MGKLDTNVKAALLTVAFAGGVIYVVTNAPQRVSAQGTAVSSQTPPAAAAADANGKATASAPKPQWLASAPGRVEPRDGEIRVVASVPGKITSVAVAVNDKVTAGDLLFTIEDEDHEARVAAAEAEVAVRTRERDQENVGKLAKDRRTAEDAVAKAEHALFAARLELDRTAAAARGKTTTTAALDKARDAVRSAVTALDKERATARRTANLKDMPLPTRLEAGLTVARSELLVAQSAFNRTRIRAPGNGSILAVNAKVGELAAPNVEIASIIVGDTSVMRVRAEFDERDIDKVKVGQLATVTTDGFPGRNFDARVTQVARSLGPPRVSAKGPRRPNDVDVLEVFVELDGQTPLLSGMRADVFLKPDQGSETKSN